MSRAARRTLAVFTLTAGSWVCRGLLVELEFGGRRPFAALSDTGIALAATLALFTLASGARTADGRAARLLDWSDAKTVPWGTLLLFGGGLSLASAIATTGVDRALGATLAGLPALAPWAILAVIVTVVVFVSEIASNTATAAAMAPLLIAAAPALGLTPATAAVVTGLAASCAFMMPVGTPGNALVYGTGAIDIRDMVRAGLFLNAVAIVILTLVGLWLVPLVLA